MAEIENSGSERPYLVVGLGNPGRTYRENRHNIGFKVVDLLAEQHAIAMTRVEMKAIVGKGRIVNRSVLLAKPQTFMNRSGDSIGPLLKYYTVPPGNLIVVYDEIDLPLGVLRLREKGGSGGHNGMKSIINHVGQDFPRLRLGIGRPPGRMEPAAYVLRNFSPDEQATSEEMVRTATQALEVFLGSGIEVAMNRYNGSIDDAQSPGLSG